MAEVLINTNSPVGLKVFWKGQPYTPDSNPIVKIYDITEDPAITPAVLVGQLLATITSTKVEVDEGSYEAHPPLSLTTRNRTLKFVWQYDIEGESITKEMKVFIVTPYADLTNACNCLGFGSDPSDPNHKTYRELMAAERYARKIIESYTGQNFYLYDDVQTVYGAGSDVLPLPYKLNSLHELYQNDILLEDTINNVSNWNYDVQISESGFGLRVNRASMLDNTVYTANGMVPPSINYSGGGVFLKDHTYRVQGRYGWGEVPDAVELACIELMRDYFSRDKMWRNKYVKNIKTFDWNFEYNGESFVGTGNLYVDRLLDDYVLTQMVVI
jgi:hypothetical protein